MIPINSGGSRVRAQHGALFEYIVTGIPLMLEFEFNPQTITRTRSVTVNTGGAPGTRGGYDFVSPTEASRASQGVSVDVESFSLTILFDATDRMLAVETSAEAHQHGVQPEIDTLRSMLEPKSQSPGGMRTLAALGQGSGAAFSRQEFASVLLFKWGMHLLPVFLTRTEITQQLHLPNLVPYRAEVSLTMQIIESKNPFYEVELRRQFGSAIMGQLL